MIKTSEIFYFPDIQQDTLTKPQTLHQSLPAITVRKPQLDFERTEEVIRQFEQREQEVILLQQPTVKPVTKLQTPVGKPSIEVDAQMNKYLHIGCTPRANFPDTVTLTILERYYQPITTTTAVTAVTTTETPVSDRRFAGETRSEGYPSSITFFIICTLILLAIVKYQFGRNMLDSLKAAFSFRQSMRLFEERREADRQAAIFANILFMMITGIFISIALPFFGANPIREDYTVTVLFFSFATGLLYFLKARIWQFLGIVFQTQRFSEIYIHHLFLFNRNAGLAILPLVTVIPYMNGNVTEYLIYGVIVIFVFSYLLRTWRIFQIIHDQNVSVLYFILYLCTLEILPLLLFAKSCKMLIEFNLFQ